MEVVKASIGKTKYETHLSASDNQLIADENIINGGTGKGFSPHELMSASLAACTSITLRMYADRKEWDLTYVDVSVAFNRIDNITTFSRQISLLGNLNDEQKARLENIANKCPIHQILSHAIQINTTIL